MNVYKSAKLIAAELVEVAAWCGYFNRRETVNGSDYKRIHIVKKLYIGSTTCIYTLITL